MSEKALKTINGKEKHKPHLMRMLPVCLEIQDSCLLRDDENPEYVKSGAKIPKVFCLASG